jgi:hypothetical protein
MHNQIIINLFTGNYIQAYDNWKKSLSFGLFGGIVPIFTGKCCYFTLAHNFML